METVSRRSADSNRSTATRVVDRCARRNRGKSARPLFCWRVFEMGSFQFGSGTDTRLLEKPEPVVATGVKKPVLMSTR